MSERPHWSDDMDPEEVVAELLQRFQRARDHLNDSGWRELFSDTPSDDKLLPMIKQVQHATDAIRDAIYTWQRIDSNESVARYDEYPERDILFWLSYELQVPLTSAYGWCQLLAEELSGQMESSRAEVRERLDRLVSSLNAIYLAVEALVPIEISSTNILGVRVDNVTHDEAVNLIATFVNIKYPRQIATVNPEFIMAAQTDAEFREVLKHTALNLPDGVGVLWAARRLGQPLRERVAGVDTVERIAQRASREGWKLYLLGAAEGVAHQAAEVLQARYPGLNVVGTYAGSPRVEEEVSIVERVRSARPDVLFVAYGAPAQDKWIARNMARLGVPVCMGVGGAFDFIAGVTPRAPRWMQRLGLEWLHRLIRQPWRWRRMLALPRFAWRVLTSPPPSS